LPKVLGKPPLDAAGSLPAQNSAVFQIQGIDSELRRRRHQHRKAQPTATPRQRSLSGWLENKNSQTTAQAIMFDAIFCSRVLMFGGKFSRHSLKRTVQIPAA
jgi:hypothetical protein